MKLGISERDANAFRRILINRRDVARDLMETATLNGGDKEFYDLLEEVNLIDKILDSIKTDKQKIQQTKDNRCPKCNKLVFNAVCRFNDVISVTEFKKVFEYKCNCGNIFARTFIFNYK